VACRTVAEVIARVCERHGVRRVFGVPGGGSSLDLIRAFAARCIPYVLARTETAAVIMAAATAEATGTFGVAITTQGPGTASAANGMAQASLDRSPVILISDGWTSKQAAYDTHQVFDQQALMAPVAKAGTRLDGDGVAAELGALVAAMTTEPWGPVYIELTSEAARRVVEDDEPPPAAPAKRKLDRSPVDAAADLLAGASKPVIVVGLEARGPGIGDRIAALASRLGAPILPTYKAKGVVPDGHPNLVGLFTGGAAEQDCVGAADLIVLCGFDPVELIGRPWGYAAPVLDLGPVRHPVHYVDATVRVTGDLTAILDALASAGSPGRWRPDEIVGLREGFATRLAYEGTGPGLSPETVVREAVSASAGLDARITVDAGAHMFSAMAFWPALRHGDVLVSNGLATMAFSLPAAIAISLETPDRPVIAFTGDGGLMMCAGELSTAAQHATRLCVVVFNDATLSLIAIKQQARQMPRAGVDWPRPDFAAVARGFGLAGHNATSLGEYRFALNAALRAQGPSLIDVNVDPSGYLAQSIALRG